MTASCGAATTPTTRAPTRTPARPSGRASTRSPPPRSTRSSPPTPPRSTSFDLDALAPLAAEVGPTVAELAEPLTELPENPSQGLARGLKGTGFDLSDDMDAEAL